jgi:hypothetical protein
MPIRYHVHVVGLDRDLAGEVDHRHRGAASQNGYRAVVVFRRHMKHNHESHAAVDRHVFEQPEQGTQPARRSTDPDDRKRRQQRCIGIDRSRQVLGHTAYLPGLSFLRPIARYLAVGRCC